MSDYNAQVNDAFEFKQLSIDELDIVPSGRGKFHILKDGRSFHAELLATNFITKQFTIRINGSDYQVNLEDHYDQLIKQLGLEVNIQHKIKDIKAPMPGLVLEIQVTEGQEVERGTPILILEAMKMENIIKSPGDGAVKKIVVEKGQAVEKGSVLVVFE
jgi:biotin carboxyl carrier protein